MRQRLSDPQLREEMVTSFKDNDDSRLSTLTSSWTRRRTHFLCIFLFSLVVLALCLRVGDKVVTMNVVSPVIPSLPSCQDAKCSPAVLRLLEYCPLAIPSGNEGILVDNNGNFELKHILVTIRHGDRSAIHRIPGSADPIKTITTEKGTSSKYLDSSVLQYVQQMSAFRLQSMKSKDSSKPLMQSLDHNSTKLFKKPDFMLDQGQLTSRGFMQHITLGTILRKAYGSFLSTIKFPPQIVVRSTNYDRTIQSVAAFLTSLLPDVTTAGVNTLASRITIKYFEEESDEIMHGIGVRSSSHIIDEKKGEKTITGDCERSVNSAKKEKESFVPHEEAMKRLDTMFGDSVRNRFITDLVDAALPSICHNRPLPCTEKDPLLCLSVDHVGQLMAEADRAFCARYTGDHGGKTATLLATYPFLQEIVNNLKAAATLSGAKGSSQNFSRPLLTIFSGHDTVVAPVLAALSVYSSTELCRWPPYASRIVFELWQPVGRAVQDINTESFVRILYNGLDLTSKIPTCHDEVKKQHGLCSLGSFAQQVMNSLGGKENLQDACKVPS